MEQRSEALRLASIRKKNQINEVQTAKDIQMKQQQDRIQKELIKSQKQEEAALQGLEKLRLKRIERKLLVFFAWALIEFTLPLKIKETLMIFKVLLKESEG